MSIAIFYRFFLGALIILTLTGCDEKGGIKLGGSDLTNAVIVDLNAVSKATGQDDVLNIEMEAVNANLTSQIQKITDNLNKVLAEQKEKFGKDITIEEQQQLQELLIKANQQLDLKRNEANQKSAQHKQNLVLTWKDKLQPVVQAIANEKGASVVLVQNPLLMWFDSSLDITAEVIAELRTNPLEDKAENEKGSQQSKEDKTSASEKSSVDNIETNQLDSSADVI